MLSGAALGALGTPAAVQAVLALAAHVQHDDAQQKLLSWLSQTQEASAIALLLSTPEDYGFADPQFALQIPELGEQLDHQSLAPFPLTGLR